MFDYSKRTDTKSYLDTIIKELNGVKIKSVFTLSSPSWNIHRGFRTYDSDTELYIMFENNMCLVIDYRFVDSLDMEFRKLTDDEIKLYEDNLIKDFFNDSTDIVNLKSNDTIYNDTIKLDYADVEDIIIQSITCEYEKWIGGSLKSVSPTEETFGAITFVMANRNTITICAADAMSDGYILFWSEDAEYITYHPF